MNDPRLRFGSAGRGDPRAQTEDIGDDAIKATTYGMKNLETIAGMLVDATAEPGKDFDRLRSAYGTLIGQMTRELGHVGYYVGGVERDNLVTGLNRSDTFRPTPKAKQKEAMDYILENGFHTQDFLLRRDIVQRIGMADVVRRISGAQAGLMRRMLSNGVVQRISNMEAGGFETYPAAEVFSDMRKGIFSEIYGKDKKTDVFRRNLQSATVDHLIASIANRPARPAVPGFGTPPSNSADFKALSRNMLVVLRTDLAKAADKANDEMSKIHFQGLAETIAVALSGKQ
jgi:hypothetical protein